MSHAYLISSVRLVEKFLLPVILAEATIAGLRLHSFFPHEFLHARYALPSNRNFPRYGILRRKYRYRQESDTQERIEKKEKNLDKNPILRYTLCEGRIATERYHIHVAHVSILEVSRAATAIIKVHSDNHA